MLMASRQPQGLAGLVLIAPSPPQPMRMPAEARETMAEAYATREAVELTIDNVLTAKPLSAADRELVIEDSLRGAPQQRRRGRGRQVGKTSRTKLPPSLCPRSSSSARRTVSTASTC